jgi:endo-1,4-beta-D-glucanase Y
MIVPLRLLCAVLLVVACGMPASANGLGQAEWLAYVSLYIAPEGRVIDTYNGRVSHSEGQGYGMLLALAYDDRGTFDRLWTWTRATLQVRGDALFAWRWDPKVKGGINDHNNATDGDLLIAWALLRAGERWQRPDYTKAADAILADVAAKLVVDTKRGKVLRPGAEGFPAKGVIVNLSYWVFPALEAFAAHQPDGPWQALIKSGLDLIGAARFGAHHLPPDWLEIGDGLTLPTGFAPVYGFNAIRIPLYLAWSDLPRAKELLAPFRDFWATFDGRGPPPATVQLVTGALDSHPLSKGGQAIMALARFGREHPSSARAMMPPLDPHDSYYTGTLLLLSKVALEKGRQL